jgi:FMN phosphatase YigB (HAD superfamily)
MHFISALAIKPIVAASSNMGAMLDATKPPQKRLLVLDAMGVIYSAGDDVADLLCPFILENKGESNRPRIEMLYHEASLGLLTTVDFWRAVGLDPAVEDDYLDRHRLTSGALDFLRAPPTEVSAIWCLSKDVSEWSRKLRDRFTLVEHIRGFVISGEVGVRKPDAAIFQNLFANMEVEARHAILVDDRQANLDTARILGMDTILFSPRVCPEPPRHQIAANFQALRQVLSQSNQKP